MASKFATLMYICAMFVVNSSVSGKENAGNGKFSVGGAAAWVSDRAVNLFYKVKAKDVTLYLYTRSDRTSGKLITKDTIKQVKMDKTLNTKIISHGWLGTHKVQSVQTLKNTYLEHRDCNVLLVDWSPIAKTFLYVVPARLVHQAGYFAANMINELIKNGLKSSKIHLIGFSLGAHLVAEAGNHIVEKIPRTTILDAAAPAVSNHSKFATAAKFVDVVHTGASLIGIYDRLGTADFYINGGKTPQADCQWYDMILQACSHNYAWVIFAYTIKHGKKFTGRQCKDTITSKISESECVGSNAYMGDSVSTSARGCYYVKAEGVPPPKGLDKIPEEKSPRDQEKNKNQK